MAEGRREKRKGKGEKRIKDNSWILSFKLFRLTEENEQKQIWEKENQEFWFGYIMFEISTKHLYAEAKQAFKIESSDPDRNPDQRYRFRCSQHIHSS